jgi:hypothetical protein
MAKAVRDRLCGQTIETVPKACSASHTQNVRQPDTKKCTLGFVSAVEIA